MRRLTVLALAVALALIGAGAAPAQDRARTKEVVIGLGAEPRTMLAVTIVDWTTNNMLEHIYDRLLDRDPKTFKPRPMLAESWRIVTDTTWEVKLRKASSSTTASPSPRTRSRPRSTTRSIRRTRVTSPPRRTGVPSKRCRSSTTSDRKS